MEIDRAELSGSVAAPRPRDELSFAPWPDPVRCVAMATKPFWEESSDDEAPEPPKKRRKRGLLDDSSSDDEKQTGAARGRSPSNAIDIDADDDETGAARERCSSNAVELDDDEDAAAAPRAPPAARARSFAESHRVYANALERSSRPASADDLAPRELFAGVTSALVTTFGTNAARQTKKFLRAHAPRDARVVVVVDGEALRGDVGAHDAVVAAPEADYAKATAHAKLMVATLAGGGLRVSVGTANFHDGDWGKTGQLAWVRDFPPARRAAAPSAFAETLAAYVRILLSKDPAAGDAWAARLLGEFDVDPGDDAHLVPVVPSEFARAVAEATRGVDALSPGEAIGAKRLKAVVAARMAGAFDAADPTHCYSSFHGASPATEALRLKADDCDVALVHWPRRGDAPRLGGAYAATRGGLVGVAEKRGAALVRFVAARPDGAPGHEPSHAKLVARAGRGGRGFVYVGSANLSAPGWRRGGFQLGVVLTNVQLGSLPLPFAVLGADGEPRGAGAFEALSPDDAWLPRRERGGPGGRRGEAARKCAVQVSRPRDQHDSAALDLEGLPPMDWKQVKDLCHGHDASVRLGRVPQPVGGRCRVPFDAREHAVAARDRINGDASGVRATLV